ncbi:putative tripeptidyl-peptidase II [Rosa chinensis]|uniref:Putative tripeptidyl-peptidase II n=1 Tax=Rosa chinensis TaxID=74649 RepID=A0A2P6Q093_ROSCH|nr:putative tripeptidyl-peptidase II [Rosa chinensis]
MGLRYRYTQEILDRNLGWASPYPASTSLSVWSTLEYGRSTAASTTTAWDQSPRVGKVTVSPEIRRIRQPFATDRKLIGASQILDSRAAAILLPQETRARRTVPAGHGTHVASIIAGRHVPNASFLGFAQGVASGVAPNARAAMYRIARGSRRVSLTCWLPVEDGCDVISLSLSLDDGDLRPYHKDPIDIAALLGNGRILTGSSLYNGTWPENTCMSLVAGLISGGFTGKETYPFAITYIDDSNCEEYHRDGKC